MDKGACFNVCIWCFPLWAYCIVYLYCLVCIVFVMYCCECIVFVNVQRVCRRNVNYIKLCKDIFQIDMF